MRDEIRNGLIATLIAIFVMLLIVGIIQVYNNQQEEKTKVCNNIGEKLDLDLYKAENGICGWGIECSYQCKFIDSAGGIVIKNVK